MILLAGLGNPGGKYARHRHNVGFMAVDAIASANGFGPARAKFQSEIREGFLDGPDGRIKALILKPQTYMNESGRAVGEAARFYKIDPADVIVFHDELDLAPGKLRIKTGGGNAGHNGLRSIEAHLGNGFKRVRIGIGHPGDKAQVTNYVLGDFSKADEAWLHPFLGAVASAAPLLATSDARFAGDVAQRLQPPAGKAAEPGTIEAQSPVPKEGSTQTAEGARPRGPLAEALSRLFRRNE